MTATPRRVLGVDPGSIRCGWGVVEQIGNRLSHVASGTIQAGRGDLNERLITIYDSLSEVCRTWQPSSGAIEGIFFQRNAQSALKLGHARGVAILAMAHAGLPITEYEPTVAKKAVVGTGRAGKDQVAAMIGMLLGVRGVGADTTDALAIAVCHLQQNPRFARSTL